MAASQEPSTQTRWLDIAFGVVVGVLTSTALVAALILIVRPPQGEPIRLEFPTPAPLVVHVVGAVARPGVYTLPPGSRIVDALEAAGGPRPDAALEALNLARPLEDGQQVYVPSRTEPAPTWLAPSPTALSAPASTDIPPDASQEARLNLNTATEKELESLPGIGPVLARRIVTYRAMHGPFHRVEDLLDVQGIGPVLLEKLRPYVYVAEVTPTFAP